MKIQPAYIDHGVRFTFRDLPAAKILQLRRDHKRETDMLWINSWPVIDLIGELYQGMTLIMIWLN